MPKLCGLIMNSLSSLIAIFIGGGTGAISRWLLSASVQSLAEKTSLHRFPLGTMACNVLGCLLIGLVFGHFASRQHPAWVFPLLVTGFLGGFTTFSTFGKDTHNLLSHGFPYLALLNIVLSTALALIAVWLGHKLGGRGA